MMTLLAAVLLVPTVTLATGVPRQRLPYPTPVWIAAQLIPSPEFIVTRGEARAAGRHGFAEEGRTGLALPPSGPVSARSP